MRDNSLAHLALRSARFSLSVSRLDDGVLLRRLARLVARDRVTTAALLAHIAEVDARRLYAPAGYPSMHAYCVGELRLSEDAACKRIQAARAARRVPALLGALAGGRLHLSAVCLLAPHVGGENAQELIAAATHRSKSEIETILWRRFAAAETLRLAPGQVDGKADRAGEDGSEGAWHHAVGSDSLAPGQVDCDNRAVDELAPGQVANPRAETLTPSPERVSLHVTIAKCTHEKLRYAQALLSHAVPSGDPAEVLDRALDALIAGLEKRKFGARHVRARREQPGPGRSRVAGGSIPGPAFQAPRATRRDRYIPAAVRRAVWERDGGRCAFVGSNGHRCESRRYLEFDHVEPVARGGRATVGGLRLRCRTHNHHEAERVFGVGFMKSRRQEARRARVEPRTRTRSEERAGARVEDHTQDILACLRRLGCRADEAKRAAEHAAALHGATLEEGLRAALQSVGRRSSSFRASERAVDASSQGLAPIGPGPRAPAPTTRTSCGSP